MAHGRALDVPSRPAFAPGTVPTDFAIFGTFPKRKIARRTFLGCGSAAFALLVVQGAIGKLSVVGVFVDVKENVTIDRVRKIFLFQILDETDNVRDVIGRTRQMINLVDAQLFQVRQIVRSHLNRDLADRNAAFVTLLNELVIDVGDVDDPSHVIPTVSQVAFDRVKDHRANHVTDVRFGVNGRSAQIDSDLWRIDRRERLLGFRQRVVDADFVLRCRHVGGTLSCCCGTHERRTHECGRGDGLGKESWAFASQTILGQMTCWRGRKTPTKTNNRKV